MNIRVAESFVNIDNCWCKFFISLKLFKQLSSKQLVEIVSWDLNVKFKISIYWISSKHGCQDWVFTTVYLWKKSTEKSLVFIVWEQNVSKFN